MLLSQSKFAQLVGVSRQTIQNGIKDKKIELDKKTKQVDPNHPKNKAFVEEMARSDKAGKKHIGPSKTIDPDKIEQDIEDVTTLEVKKLKSEIALKEEDFKYKRQKRLTQLGILVLRETVEKKEAKFGNSIKTHILNLPRKLAPRIVAMVGSGASNTEVEKFISEEFEKALVNAKIMTRDGKA